MTDTRNWGAEIDELKERLNQLQQTVNQACERINQSHGIPAREAQARGKHSTHNGLSSGPVPEGEAGKVYYSGQYRGTKGLYRWEPQERSIDQLLNADGDKTARVLAALGHIQRIDILRSVLQEPLTGAELVERLNMGTTGQLYHHIKALLGADLLVQEERGGKYSLPPHRTLPLLLLLSAAADLLDASDYLEMTEARANAGAYLGGASGMYDPHLLLWATVENSILEHREGHCSEVHLFLHGDGSITVADNGRGIPVAAMGSGAAPRVQAVLTDIGSRLGTGAAFVAPGGEKGISIAVVNALSSRLAVEVKREGRVFHQEYRYGIPQTEPIPVGITRETGTSITMLPAPELFAGLFDAASIERRADELAKVYPSLSIRVQLA